MFDDLYFSYIKINPSYKNCLVCKKWHNNLKEILKIRKADFYENLLDDLIKSKCYYEYDEYDEYIRYDEYDNDVNNKILYNAYNKMIDNTIELIVNDNIRDIFKNKLIIKYNNISILYSKYNGIIYNIVDSSIAKEQKEYKRILKKYYNINYL